MGKYEEWKKKQGGRKILLAVSLIGFTVSILGSYNYLYKPWARNRRLNEAEAYANILMQSRKSD